MVISHLTKVLFLEKNIKKTYNDKGDKMKHTFKIKELYPNIYQIEEFKKVNCTLIKGKDKAILWDMGYGVYDLKKQIDKMINTPLIVIASHGHPDHTLGCTQFNKILIPKKDKKIFKQSNSKVRRYYTLKNLMKNNPLTKKDKIKFIFKKLPEVNYIEEGSEINLGDITAKIVPLPGHTAGSIGLLLKEPKILLTGDAICNDLWIFLPESLSIKENIKNLEKTLKLPFTHYIAAHKQELYPKKQINNILETLKNLDPKNDKPRTMLKRYQTYSCKQETPYGTITIIYKQ